MDFREDNINQLLKARSEIDDELRRHKTDLTVLFTDIVGSTTYFDRYGDTAGLLLIHRHDNFVVSAVEKFQGNVIKTIGDSVMAEFPEALLATRAAVEIQRRLHEHNQKLAEHERLQVRIGINSGVVFRRDNDLFGEDIHVAARITKRSGPAQILISKAVCDATIDSEISCRPLGKASLAGKCEPEDLYEVMWTEESVYDELRSSASAPLTAAIAKRETDRLSAGAPVSDRYEILGRIGAGGMGVVFKAHDRETGEIVALKVLKPEIADLAPRLEGFKNELRLARKITHKNVCRIYDFNRSEGVAFISMEFVQGESLRHVLNRFNSLSVRQGLKLARQICDGLREAHAQGIVHRDLKPENLMIDASGNVKLMDFGLAHLITDNSTATVGTPSYMAPEQAQGAQLDQRADIYSLGLVLFEVFTGSAVFTGDTPVTVALKQIRETPPNPREIERTIPEHLERTILRCLEKEPGKRFQSIEDLQAALSDEVGTSQEGSLRRQRYMVAVRKTRHALWTGIQVGALCGSLVTAAIGVDRWRIETKQVDGHSAGTAESAAFRLAQSLDTEDAWNSFLKNYPNGQLTPVVNDRLRRLSTLSTQTEIENPEKPAAVAAIPAITAAAVTTNRSKPTPPAPPAPQSPDAKQRAKWTALMDLVTIRGGDFMMGHDAGRGHEKPRHQVKLEGFRMSRSEITNRQYLAFLEDSGHARPKDPGFAKDYLLAHPDLPVVNVSYVDAVAFCEWAGKKLGTIVRLPTESEWEYAALGGGKDLVYPWGFENPMTRARYDGNDPRGVVTVTPDAFPANGFGLRNMSGNVSEWVSDFYSKDYYKTSAIKNPTGPANGTKRVVRGGSWADDATQITVYSRNSREPGDRSDQVGFRIVVESRS
jgi:serine/threonine protein kinase/class 3 adenylate cyclase